MNFGSPMSASGAVNYRSDLSTAQVMSFSRHHSYPRSGTRVRSRGHQYPSSRRVGSGSRVGYQQYPSSIRPVSTPAPLLFDALDSVVTTAKPDPLATYHLTDYPWVSSILSPNSNTLNLQLPADGQRNATTVTLEVTSDADAPKESSDMECSPNAAAGEEHLCVYLTRCDSAKNITVEQYAVSFCTINTKYAGVCCPRSEVDVVH